MLYLIHKRNSELGYQNGQASIIHLMADLHEVIQWANEQGKQWAFTTSNAGSYHFEDFCTLDDLDKIDWQAVNDNHWNSPNTKEYKQAEFLLEQSSPWSLVRGIGVYSQQIYMQVQQCLLSDAHKPRIKVLPEWYY